MFNPISASDKIRNEFVDYLSTDFFFKDQTFQKKYIGELQKQISKGPFLEINDIYKTDKTMLDLINEGVLSKRFLDLEKDSKYKKVLPLDRPLYKHQVNAINQIVNGNNVVVSTGTGSGKTNCFLIPVIDELLKELDENGTLGDGIRALFVFPVNALANDQIKNVRKLLMNYPKITFGVYNGSTEEFDKQAKANYQATYMNSDIPELREKLPNEEISRDDMKNHPPHILFTNYAMLEYLMFRPADKSLFEKSHFKFIVLDEAHIYSGVVGIETSMLIRRLKTRLGSSKDVRFILTSATLWGSDEEIINFATNLSGAIFTPQNIIRGEREPQHLSLCERKQYPIELIQNLSDENSYIPDVLNKYGIFYDKTKYSSVDEFLYDFIFNTDLYYRLRSFGDFNENDLSNQGIFPLSEIQAELDLDDDALISFISLCTRAKKDGKQLLDAKFHFFIRTLEGCYISLDDNPELSLIPADHKSNSDQTRMFEVAVCHDCGEIALVGKIEEGILKNIKKNELGEDYFYIASTVDNDIEDAEDPEEVSDNFKSKEYLLCTKCGAISEYGINIKRPSSCHCDECKPIKIVSAHVTGDDEERHCYCHSCYSGYQRRFYLGNDGATSVLATSLYEALPKQKVEQNQSKETQNSPISRFFSTNSNRQVKSISQAAQFLTFSDSRQEAAKFASYLGRSYEEFLRRRGITQLIESYTKNGNFKVRTITDYVHDLTKLFQNKGSFKDDVSPSASNDETQAWVAMLNELARHSSRNSLTSLGFLQFKYLGNYSDEMKRFIQEVAAAYSVSEKTVLDLLDLLIMELIDTGAVSTTGDFDIGDEQRQYIWYSKSQRYITLNYDSNIFKNIHWLPRRKDNGKYQKTKKLKYVMNALHISEDDAADFLEEYFNYLTNNDYPLKEISGGLYTLPASYIQVILPGEEDAYWYRCDKCGRIQTNLVDGHCNYSKCNACIEKEISDPASLHVDNHFAKLYQNGNMTPLVIKEHTAQLDRTQGLKYQQDFINKKINVLSCSTTFEMGVDIGDLEAVFLRDMPPTPSNYNQRAGRAGRSVDSAAYVLSFAKLSSHDFYFFNRPMSMISGTILPPFFKLDNTDIARRHIYATVLSEFFRVPDYEDYFDKNSADAFLNGKPNGEKGYDVFCSWLNEKRENDDLDLKLILMSSIPDVEGFHEELGLNDYSWVDGLIGPYGVLNKLISEYDYNVQEFNDINKDLINQLGSDPTNSDLSRRINNNTDNLNRYRNKKLIDFLSRGGVLPRYGFPVDTVELEQYGGDMGNQLNLTRDLTMAISEYAPSSEVIADNHLYTSRYINKSILDQKYGWKIDYIATCGNPDCKAKIFSVTPPDKNKVITCPCCGTPIEATSFKESIEPIAGFVADEKVKPVPMNRQERSYNAPIFYLGDGKDVDKEMVNFSSGRTIELQSTKDDSLLVMSNNPFYVCKACGYAVSTDESNPFLGEPFGNYSKALYAKSDHITSKVFKHKRTNGNECGCHDFTRYYLHHIFKTDVAKITFTKPPQVDPKELKSTMYSVMYAIFNAIRYDLQIDKNDIGCCLSLNYSGKQPIYSIIIYDQITGGSGYAKKIVKDGEKGFKKIIYDAYINMSKCDCDPSCYNCLMSYENRMYHDELDRKKAMKFLENYLEGY